MERILAALITGLVGGFLMGWTFNEFRQSVNRKRKEEQDKLTEEKTV